MFRMFVVAQCLGKETTFPKGEDPDRLLAEGGYGCKAVRRETECTLAAEDYMRGFVLMNKPEREAWIHDIQEGFYKLEKLPESEVQPRKKKSRKRRRVSEVIEDEVEDEMADPADEEVQADDADD